MFKNCIFCLQLFYWSEIERWEEEKERLEKEITRLRKGNNQLTWKPNPIRAISWKSDKLGDITIPSKPSAEVMPFSDFKKLHTEETGFSQFQDQNWILNLNLFESGDRSFLQKVDRRIPDIREVWLKSIPAYQTEIVNSFLTNYFPTVISGFYMQMLLVSDIEVFIDSLVVISRKVTQKITLSNFYISGDNLVKIFDSYNKTRELNITYCTLSLTQVPNFGKALWGCKLKSISFEGWGNVNHGDWSKNSHHFENLIEGLATSHSIKNNLERISIMNCGMTQEEGQEVLDKHGLEDTEIMYMS